MAASTTRRLSRRSLLTAGAAASALGSAAAATPPTFRKSQIWQPDKADAPKPEEGEDYRFFTAAEAALMAALLDCIIPSDEHGPGAHEAGVTLFLDRQLAGKFGHAQSLYMQGPWPKGTEQQGYQTKLTPAGMYRAAIKAIDAHAKRKYGKGFAQLSRDQQDAIVHELENESVDLGGAPKHDFFQLLLQNASEGYFSDPLYGGNRDMAGWKMLGFPGAHYDYRPHVSQHNKKLDIPPAGIYGGPAWKGDT